MVNHQNPRFVFILVSLLFLVTTTLACKAKNTGTPIGSNEKYEIVITRDEETTYRKDDFGLFAEPGVVLEDTVIEVIISEEESLHNETDGKTVGSIYDLNVNENLLVGQVLITLPYEESEVSREEEVVIAYFDQERNRWVQLLSWVDADANVVSAYVNHFTEFAPWVWFTDKPPEIIDFHFVPSVFSVDCDQVESQEWRDKHPIKLILEVNDPDGLDDINDSPEIVFESSRVFGPGNKSEILNMQMIAPGIYEIEFTISLGSDWNLSPLFDCGNLHNISATVTVKDQAGKTSQASAQLQIRYSPTPEIILIDPINHKHTSTTPTFNWQINDPYEVMGEYDYLDLVIGQGWAAKTIHLSVNDQSYILSEAESLEYGKSYTWQIQLGKNTSSLWDYFNSQRANFIISPIWAELSVDGTKVSYSEIKNDDGKIIYWEIYEGDLLLSGGEDARDHRTIDIQEYSFSGENLSPGEYGVVLTRKGMPISDKVIVSIPDPSLNPEPEALPPCPLANEGDVILYQHSQHDCGGEGENFGWVGYNSTGYSAVPGSFNDRASSIFIRPGWSVMLFEHDINSGGYICLNESNPDFPLVTFENGLNLNDQVSTFEVFDVPDCNGLPLIRPDFYWQSDYIQEYWWEFSPVSVCLYKDRYHFEKMIDDRTAQIQLDREIFTEKGDCSHIEEGATYHVNIMTGRGIDEASQTKFQGSNFAYPETTEIDWNDTTYPTFALNEEWRGEPDEGREWRIGYRRFYDLVTGFNVFTIFSGYTFNSETGEVDRSACVAGKMIYLETSSLPQKEGEFVQVEWPLGLGEICGKFPAFSGAPAAPTLVAPENDKKYCKAGSYDLPGDVILEWIGNVIPDNQPKYSLSLQFDSKEPDFYNMNILELWGKSSDATDWKFLGTTDLFTYDNNNRQAVALREDTIIRLMELFESPIVYFSWRVTYLNTSFEISTSVSEWGSFIVEMYANDDPTCGGTADPNPQITDLNPLILDVDDFLYGVLP